jgi:hypothetical protein
MGKISDELILRPRLQAGASSTRVGIPSTTQGALPKELLVLPFFNRNRNHLHIDDVFLHLHLHLHLHFLRQLDLQILSLAPLTFSGCPGSARDEALVVNLNACLSSLLGRDWLAISLLARGVSNGLDTSVQDVL